VWLGIEIGGTKLQLGVGAGEGSGLAELVRRDVDRSQGADGILRSIEESVSLLQGRHPVRGIGFGFGGPVDTGKGRVITSHQVNGWEGFEMADWCTDRFGLPIVLGNDCNAAALAEARFGAGRDYARVFYVTVGTGIGGGYIVNGILQAADSPAASEIGHLRPGLDAEDPGRTLESLAAGPGIEAAARARIADAGHTSPEVAELLVNCGGDLSQLTVKQVGEAAAGGHALSRDILGQANRALGWGIAQVITLLGVHAVIVGGGVSLLGEELFYKPLRDFVSAYVFPPLRGTFDILPPALGEEVVVHGALAFARDGL
jgi:glucokinase